MRPFTYVNAASLEDAVGAVDASASKQAKTAAQYLAGGTTVLDLMKLDVLQPPQLVSIRDMNADAMSKIDVSPKGLRLGALVKMSETADHAEIKSQYPVLAQSLTLAASQQIRNMATLGGNILQRTRCSYYRDPSWTACNKREPGSGCAAIGGVNRQHAILGASDSCIATYPGDFAQALIALDAQVEIMGEDGPKVVAFAKLHKLPADRPDVETSLKAGELITAIVVPAGPWTQRSVYLKIRDRDSYQFALASAAVALDITDGKIQQARVAIGGVATVPWRANAAEELLRGKTLDQPLAQAAGEAAFENAKALKHNGFKIALGKKTVERALLQAAAMEVAR